LIAPNLQQGTLFTGPALANQPSGELPSVVSVGLLDGSPINTGDLLTAPPPGFVIQFNEPVNLPQLFIQGFETTGQNQTQAAWIHGSNGGTYYLRELFFTDTNAMSFLLYDALPNGVYQLHLSGAAGLSDRAGNPLVGNDPSGDYVLTFTVNGPARGTNGNPLLWTDQEPNDTVSNSQDLGVLFPSELGNRVTITRDFTAQPQLAPSDGADDYQFTLLQRKQYTFTLNDAGAPTPIQIGLFTASGHKMPVRQLVLPNSVAIIVTLDPGTYVVRLSGWSPNQAASVAYRLGISIGQVAEVPPTLPVGSGSASQISHVTGGVVGSPLPPPVTLTPAANASDIQLVSFSGTATLPNVADIPTPVILALGTGPVGADGTAFASGFGTQSEADLYDRLLVKSTSLAFADLAVRLPILIQAQTFGPGTNQMDSKGLASVLQILVRRFDPSGWRWALDLLHSVNGRTHAAALASPGPATDTSSSDGSQDDGSETETPLQFTDASPLTLEGIWMPVLTVAAALAAIPLREEKNAQEPVCPRQGRPDA
jgi:hypothetical protein